MEKKNAELSRAEGIGIEQKNILTRSKTVLTNLFTARNMAEGEPWKRIAEFAVPMLLGNMAQQLYNTVDSVVVGRYVGDNALAAVGSASPILT